MKQFRSVKARRRSKFGGGIKSRWLAPTGVSLSADPDSFIVEPPFGDPIRQAAYIERCYRFEQGYHDLWTRLHGSETVDDTNLPPRYKIGYVDQVFQTLWVHMLAGKESTWGPALPQPGDVVFPAAYGGDAVIIATVTPVFTRDMLIDEVTGPDSTPLTWAIAGATGLCTVSVSVPLRQITYNQPVSDAFPSYAPALNFFVTAAPTLQSVALSITQLAIELLLYGKCTAPDGANPGIAFAPPFAQGDFAEDWLAYIEVCAGRILWQMAMCETLGMQEDMYNQDKGGVGGLVQEPSKLVTILPPPAQPNPGPVTNPPFPWLNSVLEHSAVEIVLWVVETLL